MSKSTFIAGDKVRIVKSGYGTAPEDVGKVTTVLSTSPGYVVYDTQELHIGTYGWAKGRYTGNAEAFERVVSHPLVRNHNQVRADRRKELLDGVVAYHTAGKAVPDEWIAELAGRY